MVTWARLTGVVLRTTWSPPPPPPPSLSSSSSSQSLSLSLSLSDCETPDPTAFGAVLVLSPPTLRSSLSFSSLSSTWPYPHLWPYPWLSSPRPLALLAAAGNSRENPRTEATIAAGIPVLRIDLSIVRCPPEYPAFDDGSKRIYRRLTQRDCLSRRPRFANIRLAIMVMPE